MLYNNDENQTHTKTKHQMQLQIDGTKMDALRDEIEDTPLVHPQETENTKSLEEVTPISIHSNHPDHHVMIGTD